MLQVWWRTQAWKRSQHGEKSLKYWAGTSVRTFQSSSLTSIFSNLDFIFQNCDVIIETTIFDVMSKSSFSWRGKIVFVRREWDQTIYISAYIFTCTVFVLTKSIFQMINFSCFLLCDTVLTLTKYILLPTKQWLAWHYNYVVLTDCPPSYQVLSLCASLLLFPSFCCQPKSNSVVIIRGRQWGRVHITLSLF